MPDPPSHERKGTGNSLPPLRHGKGKGPRSEDTADGSLSKLELKAVSIRRERRAGAPTDSHLHCEVTSHTNPRFVFYGDCLTYKHSPKALTYTPVLKKPKTYEWLHSLKFSFIKTEYVIKQYVGEETTLRTPKRHVITSTSQPPLT